MAKRSLQLGALLALAGTVHGETTTSAPQNSAATPADGGLTWNGITLYGIVDIGLQYMTHGAPISEYYPAGSADIIQKNGNRSVTGVTPSNLSQSRVGLQGTEPIVGDWSGVFKLETFFNPQSGNISDALKSLTQNNGRALTAQTTNLDSSAAGQAFIQAFAGLSSKTFGTFTLGRQNTLLADAVAKYDPNAASQAFSLIGLSGTSAGGGDTQNRRFDNSVKYVGVLQGVHVGAQYKFSNATGSANTAVQVQIGGEFAGFSVDAYYAKIKDAIAASPLNAAQVADLPTLGLSVSNSLAGTVSDNTSYMIVGMYTLSALRLYAGYEHIKFANPDNPLPVGFDDIGGYKLAVVNNTAFANDKVLQVFWAGAKYSLSDVFDIAGAYYGYKQNSFATGKLAGCDTVVSGSCSGTLNTVSIDGVYRMSKRFDAYAGAMYTGVKDGLANGYLNTNNINPTIGVRFRF